MKILLHSNALTKRGDSITISSYAKALKKNYDIDSDLVYDINDKNNVPDVVKNLKKEGFQVFGYEKFIELDQYASREKIDTIYWLKNGHNDRKLLKDCKNCVHTVFNVVAPHGDVYAYVSEWLSIEARKNYRSRIFNSLISLKGVLKNNFDSRNLNEFFNCSFSNIIKPFDFVPHIIDLPKPTINFRNKYNISNSSFLIGRIGGYTEFNIDFVKECIKKILDDDKNNIFIFVNTEQFIQNDRVLFINDYIDEYEKSSFIASCDMMIHARKMGETFGFAIAESLSMNIPIVACTTGQDKNHHILLKNTNLLYNNKDQLFEIYTNIKEGKFNNINLKEQVKDFTPEKVAEKFKNIFLS